ncbi:MAG: SIMPL domain-containing protein [Coriobacteriia bacterium]|nr:SIMPL domain-containing protein [Coriobacteriia bacterium]
MNTKAALALGLTLGVLTLAGCTTKVLTTEDATPLHTVTAGGVGVTLAAPDIAEMHFGTTVLAQDAKTALGQANETAEKITAAVKDAGVATEDIQTANVNVWPEQDHDGETTTITGYRASIQVRVKIRDIDEIGTVIGAASDAGANEIGGPSFLLDDDAAARSEAIALAIADSRMRAEAMAKAAGKSLGEIISVSETGASTPVYYRADAAVLGAAANIAIEPGQLDITTSVTVVFELK